MCSAAAAALTGRCAADEVPMITRRAGVGDEAALGRVTPLQALAWERERPFIDEAVAGGAPVLLRGTVVDGWAGRAWTWARLRELHRGRTLDGVQTGAHVYLEPDTTAALRPRLHTPQRAANWSADALFGALEAAERDMAAAGGSYNPGSAAARREWRARTEGYDRGLLHFGAVPDALAAELQPGNLLYLTAADAAARMQYTWMSSPGLRTHTHFDSDHNVFVQLIGRKRFVLWAPNQTAHLCPFPRLHPLWHKSRADFEAPDTSLPPCANYSRAEAIVADVERKPPPSATNQLPPCEAATECMYSARRSGRRAVRAALLVAHGGDAVAVALAHDDLAVRPAVRPFGGNLQDGILLR